MEVVAREYEVCFLWILACFGTRPLGLAQKVTVARNFTDLTHSVPPWFAHWTPQYPGKLVPRNGQGLGSVRLSKREMAPEKSRDFRVWSCDNSYLGGSFHFCVSALPSQSTRAESKFLQLLNPSTNISGHRTWSWGVVGAGEALNRQMYVYPSFIQWLFTECTLRTRTCVECKEP